MKAAGRVARLRALMDERGLDAVVVTSITDVMWLTGFEHVFDSEEAHTAVVTGKRCALHTDSRYSTALKARAAEEDLWEINDERVGGAAFVAHELNAQGLRSARVGVDVSASLKRFRAYEKALPDMQLVECDGDILRLRHIKEPEEIQRIQAAMDVAAAAWQRTVEHMRPGMTEVEVAFELEFEMRRGGAEELAFANIVASGPNSANPHALPSDRKLQHGDLVVMDFGARVNGYRSDTTRTLCIGEPNPQQQAIYGAVLRAQQEVEKALRAGVTGVQMHELAESVLADAGFAGKMGHGLGHGVGLDIHEGPLLNSRNNEPLPAGAVVTVEPGVYLPGSNGVRIEDFGQVTDDGFMNFCPLPHELTVIE